MRSQAFVSSANTHPLSCLHDGMTAEAAQACSQVSMAFAQGWVKLMRVIHAVISNDTVPTTTNVMRSIAQSSLKPDINVYLKEGGR